MTYRVNRIGGDRWGITSSCEEGRLYHSKDMNALISKAKELAQRDKVILYIYDQTGRIAERKDYRGGEE